MILKQNFIKKSRVMAILELPIENYVLDYFVILTLSLSEGEESHPFSPNRFFN
jgi:hypothetical protein